MTFMTLQSVCRNLAVFVFISLALVTSFGESRYQQDPNCGQSDVTNSNNNRIVGGNKTEPGEFPWLVTLRYYKQHMCGASIVDSRFVLTASHCFKDTGLENSEGWSIVAGEHSIHTKEGNEVELNVKKILSHPQYNSVTNEHDIALLLLDGKLPHYSKHMRPVCLPENGTEVDRRVPVTVSGWGTEQFGVNRYSDTPKKVDVFTYDTTRCANIYRILVSGATVVPNTMLCAGHITGGRDSCQGDSGGPLMKMEDDGRWNQVGIVSWGSACGRPLLAGVYTKVSAYRTWIEETIGANNGARFFANFYYLIFLLFIVV